MANKYHNRRGQFTSRTGAAKIAEPKPRGKDAPPPMSVQKAQRPPRTVSVSHTHRGRSGRTITVGARGQIGRNVRRLDLSLESTR